MVPPRFMSLREREDLKHAFLAPVSEFETCPQRRSCDRPEAISGYFVTQATGGLGNNQFFDMRVPYRGAVNGKRPKTSVLALFWPRRGVKSAVIDG